MSNRNEAERAIEPDAEALNGAVWRELGELATFIQNSRSEIAAIRPEEICDLHIPRATDQLDEVIRMAEEATGDILDAAEAIEAVCPRVAPEEAKAIQEAVTNIYQACNFQDVTGQRVSKVVGTLQHIEQRLGTLLGLLGRNMTESPQAAEATGEAALLNGPQLPAFAHNQSDIDALFASL